MLTFGAVVGILFALLVLVNGWQKLKLKRKREQTLKRIQQQRGSRVITMIHRQDKTGIMGVPIAQHISIEDAESVLAALERIPEDMLVDFVVHTPGGIILPSAQIARAISQHKGPVRVIVPHYAMSGGSLIALAADEIVMSPHAVLGPIDPQINGYPAPSLMKLMQIKSVDEISDAMIVNADVAAKATQQIQSLIEEVLTPNYGQERARRIANLLTQGKWTHDYPITVSQAQQMGLRVTDQMPDAFLTLLSLYPQPTQTKSSVESKSLGRVAK